MLPCQTECEQASDPNMAQIHADLMLFSVLFCQALQTAIYESLPIRRYKTAVCFFLREVSLQYLTCLALQVAVACAMYDMSVQSVW